MSTIGMMIVSSSSSSPPPRRDHTYPGPCVIYDSVDKAVVSVPADHAIELRELCDELNRQAGMPRSRWQRYFIMDVRDSIGDYASRIERMRRDG